MDNNDPRDWPMIRYDQMDLNNPPDGIKLEACPNCGLPAVAKRFRVFWRFIHIAWERDRKKPRPRHFCDAYDNGRVDTCMPVLSHPSRAQRYEQVVVEQTKGSYKQFRDPGNALLADYPLEGMTYPTDYGSLPGYVGEDGDDLDVFKGSNDRGEFGRFFVFRPDIEGGMETKFYFGMTPDERAQVFTAFGPVLRGKPEAFPDHELLEAALNLYRAKEEACST